MLQLFSSLLGFRRSIAQLWRLKLFWFGVGVSLYLLAANQAYAAGTVLLQSRDLRLTVPLTDLQEFASDRTLSPALQQFLQDANQSPDQVQQWLTTEIAPPQQLQQISSDFVLLQINKIISEPLGRESSEPLRIAFQHSLEDDRAFSVIELLEHYPAAGVRLEVSQLGQAFQDVEQLVTRIEPVLSTTRALLPELICECQQAAKPSEVAYHRDSLKSSSPAIDAATSATHSAVLSANRAALDGKNLVIRYVPFSRSISIQELTDFAETGRISRGWRSILSLAGADADVIRAALNQEVAISLQMLDRTLNNILGEYLLYQVGQIVHTQSNSVNIQALRSAVVLSAAEDGRLSLLEILQHYPTRQVYVNARQLARLGQIATQFQAGGGVGAAAISTEDWLVELQVAASESSCACEDQPTENPTVGAPPIAPTISAEQIAKFLPVNWQPVAPHRVDRGIIKAVWLQGTPYEMGYQHGQYLHDEIASLGPEILGGLRFAGRGLGLGRLAARRSYPEVVEECRGLTAATEDIGMTIDACLVLAFGDVYQEIFGNALPNVLFWDGCSQWVAAGSATVDGQLYHGSSLDNNEEPIDYILNNPVVFVRQPNDGLPHITIAYPGVVWPNWGLNVAGITLGLDSAHPNSPDELRFEGGSEVQTLAQILRTATSFDEARQIMETQPRVRANLIMIADGSSKSAGVFEVTGQHLGLRELQENGALYTTNHFVSDEMFDRQRPASASSLSRFERFAQLMEPNGNSSHSGEIDAAVTAKIGRDRVNPQTLEASPLDVFDDDASPGGNGSLRQGVFDPTRLLFWVAAGEPPVPENPFVCFSLGEMLDFPNPTACASPAL